MAEVWLARSRAQGRFVHHCALKVLRSSVTLEPRERARFLREAEIAASIHHANVVDVIDVGEADGVLYQAMTFVDGDSLAGLLRRAKGPLPLGAVLAVVVDALRGLHAAHEARAADGTPLDVVHRDVSPQNILVGRDGLARISDFGIALSRIDESTGSQIGKFSYFAPEQVERGRLDRRTDVFATGIVLWEALTGARLFKRDDFVDTFAAIRAGEIPDPRTVTPAIPAPVAAVVMKALDREPDRRHATAAAMADALVDAAAEAEIDLGRAEVAATVERLRGNVPTPGSPDAPTAGPGVTDGTTDVMSRPPVRRGAWRAAAVGGGLVLLASTAIASITLQAGRRTAAPSPPPPALASDPARDPATPSVRAPDPAAAVAPLPASGSALAPGHRPQPRRGSTPAPHTPHPPYTANPFGGR
jgi:serine/threonine-protein kinase